MVWQNTLRYYKIIKTGCFIRELPEVWWVHKKWLLIPGLFLLLFLIILQLEFSLFTSPQNQAVSRHLTSATPELDDVELQEAMFYEQREENAVQCRLCFRNCLIPEGERGFCRARENREGELKSLVYGRPAAVHIDPVEKEPQHHMLPGSNILCIGTAGCNFACRHCHNWQLSQRTIDEMPVYELPPEEVVNRAKEANVPTISFTYNDPIVSYEYLYDVARLAREEGIKILWHSNVAINPEPLRKMLEHTDSITVDLKGFSEEAYENSDARLEPVLQSLEIIAEHDVWLEVVNLVIPTINDSPEEIREMCEWIKENLGPDVPLHFSRFTPAYRLTDLPPTPVETLEEAVEIAEDVGLHYVTIGNVPGHRKNSTFCPKCGERLIHRVHFSVLSNNIHDGHCSNCNHEIPGLWE